VDRIFTLFDENDDKVINFREFLCGLSVFCKKGTLEEKLRFSFNVYDVDGDGNISRNELHMMLKASLFENHMDLSEDQMVALVDATFAEADLNGDGLISYDEYRVMVDKHPNIISNMTLSNSIIDRPPQSK